MLKVTRNTPQMIFALLVQLVMVRSIIVERNFHAYYRLPLQLPPTTTPGVAQQFHILQCPHKSTADIPAPKNMEICIVVGKYEEKEAPRNSGTNRTVAPPANSGLHTKVRYTVGSQKQLPWGEKTQSGRKTRYMIVIRPVRLQLRQDNKCAPHAARQRKRRIPRFNSVAATALKRQPTATIRQIVDQSVGSSTRAKKHLRDTTTAATIAASLTEAPDTRDQHGDEYAASIENDYDDSTQGYAADYVKTRPDTVLKYLNAKDAIEQLAKSRLGPSKGDAGKAEEAEKFFAEHQDRRRGEKLHGYQNYYHRDEIFNDHIFYDDLKQRGHYRHNGKHHEKY